MNANKCDDVKNWKKKKGLSCQSPLDSFLRQPVLWPPTGSEPLEVLLKPSNPSRVPRVWFSSNPSLVVVRGGGGGGAATGGRFIVPFAPGPPAAPTWRPGRSSGSRCRGAWGPWCPPEPPTSARLVLGSAEKPKKTELNQVLPKFFSAKSLLVLLCCYSFIPSAD